MGEYMLETHHVSKAFGKQLVVDDVSIKVKKQTVYGLLGPNGAGKSTLLKMLTGLLRPTKGEIMINGHPWSRKDLKDIGVLIESPALYGNLTAHENLLVHAKLLHLPESRIQEVLNIVGLENTGKKKASQFSLGMKQRLGIAKALLNHPKLLILDEPTNGLDPLGIQDLRKLIQSFTENGITVILSSHILSEVKQLADYIGIIQNGKLRYEGKMDESQDLEKLFVDVVNE
ncbi:lantibiotic protection ABC transporter ATP-binding protein [Anoxybacillus flavithermus]|uniref:lantibiotic protection ABC transporter ATP-binding protein n=1 Tax=Anoxybacillus flavithermus TaxID=33934 RepID=UPI0018660A3A|nr:lantibiotic protection ABC transporter ATP-binding protein [Anoxybacillus flavithermus]MBE2927572.1 lantibiotic protection ABC transporter ATP-binding protein [Anoxybacillus flavithermus]MBE2938324.1 lantibiotic protection ABC transporter ATP-binding protein [Anoxybacillus flavithermus]MBE2946655.1 lantibiotic protection ABC transporter ATP-binding protein [Anoxybacillus flavithermus]MBE2949433.1 lantibiotic protection ABC transporter ATP-binding protein [Anoxybacillus flavithermus]